MTCIVGLVHDNKVYIGGDSAGVAGYDITLRRDEKVFKNGKMVFGFTTSFRMGQLLRYSLKIPAHRAGVDDFKYLCTTFMDSVMKCFKEKGFAKVKNNEEEGGTFLLGYKGKLYQVCGNFQVGQSFLPYDSVGCGYAYALGTMRALTEVENMTPEEKIIAALECAEHFSAGVKSPFKIIGV